jgi:hypothetical protein
MHKNAQSPVRLDRWTKPGSGWRCAAHKKMHKDAQKCTNCLDRVADKEDKSFS